MPIDSPVSRFMTYDPYRLSRDDEMSAVLQKRPVARTPRFSIPDRVQTPTGAVGNAMEKLFEALNRRWDKSEVKRKRTEMNLLVDALVGANEPRFEFNLKEELPGADMEISRGSPGVAPRPYVPKNMQDTLTAGIPDRYRERAEAAVLGTDESQEKLEKKRSDYLKNLHSESAVKERVDLLGLDKDSEAMAAYDRYRSGLLDKRHLEEREEAERLRVEEGKEAERLREAPRDDAEIAHIKAQTEILNQQRLELEAAAKDKPVTLNEWDKAIWNSNFADLEASKDVAQESFERMKETSLQFREILGGEAGAIYSGPLASILVPGILIMDSLFPGIVGDADRARRTREWQAARGKAVGRIITLFGSGTGLSDADREYAQKIAGGDIGLTEETIRRIIALEEKYNKLLIYKYRKDRESFVEKWGFVSEGIDKQLYKINDDDWEKWGIEDNWKLNNADEMKYQQREDKEPGSGKPGHANDLFNRLNVPTEEEKESIRRENDLEDLKRINELQEKDAERDEDDLQKLQELFRLDRSASLTPATGSGGPGVRVNMYDALFPRQPRVRGFG